MRWAVRVTNNTYNWVQVPDPPGLSTATGECGEPERAVNDQHQSVSSELEQLNDATVEEVAAKDVEEFDNDNGGNDQNNEASLVINELNDVSAEKILAPEVEEREKDGSKDGKEASPVVNELNDSKSENESAEAERGEFIDSAPLLDIKPCHVKLKNLSPRALTNMKKVLAYSHRLRPHRSTPRTSARAGFRKANKRTTTSSCCTPQRNIPSISPSCKGRADGSDGLSGAKPKKRQKYVTRDFIDEICDVSLDSDNEVDPRQSELYRKIKKVLKKQWEPKEVPEGVIWNQFYFKLGPYERQFYPPPWHELYRGPGIRVSEWEFEYAELRRNEQQVEQVQFYGATGPPQTVEIDSGSGGVTNPNPPWFAWFVKNLHRFLHKRPHGEVDSSEEEQEKEDAEGNNGDEEADNYNNVFEVNLVEDDATDEEDGQVEGEDQKDDPEDGRRDDEGDKEPNVEGKGGETANLDEEIHEKQN